MNAFETFRLAVESLFVNKMRAALTTLGIIIGVAAVVSIISLGRGVEAFIVGQFGELGANLLTVSSTRPVSGYRQEIMPLTNGEMTGISDLPGVLRVSGTYSVANTTVSRGPESVLLNVEGVLSNYGEMNAWETLPGGRFISDEDVTGEARVVVLGRTTVEDLFGNADANPIGIDVLIAGRVFTIVGIMAEKDGGALGDINAAAFVPLSTAQTRLASARVSGGDFELSRILVQAESTEVMDTVRGHIESFLRVEHEVRRPGDEDFSVSDPAQQAESAARVTSIITVFLGVVAGVSLLVGGIGVMNIMLVSVTERTREIGLRKAVGARGTDILGQFLLESLMLSLLGGAIGVLVGYGTVVLGNAINADLGLTLSADAILLATGVSTAIGLFFGIWPASRAARMRPIDALRFE